MEHTQEPHGGITNTIETLQKLARKSETNTDWLIDVKVKVLEKPPKPGHFSDRLQEKDSGGTAEKNLPVMGEAHDIIQKGQERGRYIAGKENPLGSHVSKAVLFIFGDRHITGSYPEEEGEVRSPLLHIIRNLGPRSILERMKRGDWGNDEKPRRTVDAARGIFEAIRGDIMHHERIVKDPQSAIAICNIGDDGGNELTLGDYAHITREDDGAIEELEHIFQDFSGRADIIPSYIRIRGNHDSDINNKGLEILTLLSEFSPTFTQEIGESYILLSLDTNLGSSFWWKSIIRELQVHPEQEALAKKAIDLATTQTDIVNKTLEKAKKDNKNIILMGHDEEIIKKMIPLRDSNITHIISGHYHTGKHEETDMVNIKGNKITRIRVGSSFVGMTGWEKEQKPQSYSIEIDPIQENPVLIKPIKTPDWIKKAHVIT